MGAGLRRAIAAVKRSRYPGTPAVKPRQRWRDVDRRSAAAREARKQPALREVVVLRIEERTKLKTARGWGCTTRERVPYDAAICDVYVDGKPTGRTVAIDVSRFVPNSTGYEYVGQGQP